MTTQEVFNHRRHSYDQVKQAVRGLIHQGKLTQAKGELVIKAVDSLIRTFCGGGKEPTDGDR